MMMMCCALLSTSSPSLEDVLMAKANNLQDSNDVVSAIFSITNTAIAGQQEYAARWQGLDIYSTVKHYLSVISDPKKINVGLASYGRTFGAATSADVLSRSKGGLFHNTDEIRCFQQSYALGRLLGQIIQMFFSFGENG